MTESEAKRKWCPGAMAHNGDSDNTLVLNRNSWGDPAPNCTCITYKCACWVWDEKKEEPFLESDRQGHCGLAR